MDCGLSRHISVLVWTITLALTTSATPLDLAGVFSSDICDDVTINETLHVLPVCECRRRYRATTLDVLCGIYDDFANCVEGNISAMKTGGFSSLLFDKTRFLSSMKFICDRKEDAKAINKCANSATVQPCHIQFKESIKNNISTPFTEKYACERARVLGRCYWQLLKKDCSVKQRHLWTKLAHSFETWECTKYELTEYKRCDRLSQLYHTKRKELDYKQCLDKLKTQKECFIQEKLGSRHHGHIWENMEFELKRYIAYSKFRCEIEYERESSCDLKIRKCGKLYYDGYTLQTKMIKQGQNVSVTDICSVYDHVTACIKTESIECPIALLHVQSLFCGSMPKSCNCPINLEQATKEVNERRARFSASRSVAVSDFQLSPIISVLYFFSLSSFVYVLYVF